MKSKRIKFVSLDFVKLNDTKCYLCKKKNKYCKCVRCKFCGEILRKGQNCKYCRKKNKINNFIITNGELNALEDLGLVDLKTMLKEKREKEIEIWQDRCKAVWHRLVKKIDK